MRKSLLMSVAAIALIGGANVAFSQGGSPAAAPGAGAGGASTGGASQSAPMNTPSGPSGGTMDTTPGTTQSPGAPKGAQDRTAPQKQQQTQSPQQAPGAKQGEQAPGAKQQQQTQTPQQAPAAKQGAAEQAPGAKQGAAERPMTSSNVSLTTEQKTTIRTTVMTGSAPRVTNVNFDIKVGTVVPRTVRVAPLPVTLIEIQPNWRGYMYFVHGDEIIVVEPGTLRIVAVIDV